MTWMLIATGFTGAYTLLFFGRALHKRFATPPSVAVSFSPKGGCTETVVREIQAARKEILVLAYSFTSRAIAPSSKEPPRNRLIVAAASAGRRNTSRCCNERTRVSGRFARNARTRSRMREYSSFAFARASGLSSPDSPRLISIRHWDARTSSRSR